MKSVLPTALTLLLVATSSLFAQRKNWESRASAAILQYARTITAKESRDAVDDGSGKRSLYEEGMRFFYSDLDGDGDPDAAASFFTEGLGSGSGLGHTVICLNEKRGPSIVLHLYDGDLSDMLRGAGVREIGNSRSGVRLDSVNGSRLRFITYDYHPDDGMCCPSIQGEVEFVYADRRLGFSRVLVLARRREEGAPVQN